MKVLEAQQALSGNEEAAGEGTLQIITHSRGNAWVAKNLLTNRYLTVTFATNEFGEVFVEKTEERKSTKALTLMSDGTQKKARKTTHDLPSLGYLKIGRNHMPARKFSNGTVERNTKADGTGSWVPVTDRQHPVFN